MTKPLQSTEHAAHLAIGVVFVKMCEESLIDGKAVTL